MKRPGIPWDNYCMRKYGVSIKKVIYDAHVPFIRVTHTIRQANMLVLAAVTNKEQLEGVSLQ